MVEEASGAAAKAGMQAGDIILALNSTPVSSVEQLRKALEKSGKRAAVLVQRDAGKLYVPVDLG
ncbi:Zinc metalloprotease Rip1 [compost metagenome]